MHGHISKVKTGIKKEIKSLTIKSKKDILMDNRNIIHFFVEGEYMQNLYTETRNILKKYNITANKSLGQNFLINEQVVEEIVNAAEITKEDLIIEIGPGLGTLTNELIQEAGRLICIELDKKMLKILEDRFKLYDNIEIINIDVLKADLKSIIEETKKKYGLKQVKIVANLPYYITTPIIMKLLEEKLDIQTITVMIQKEVAERITEIPGGKLSGAITYSVNYYSKPKFIFEVPKESFIPEPEVTSAVIKLEILDKPPIELNNEETFFKLLKIIFSGRRKTLLNVLNNANILSDKQKISKMLEELNIEEGIRGERLSMLQCADIANYIGGI